MNKSQYMFPNVPLNSCHPSLRTPARRTSPNHPHSTQPHRSSRKLCVSYLTPSINANLTHYSVGMYTSGPVWGRIVDTRGPRISLASSFLLLLLGYSGIRYIFDAGIPASADTISTFTICLLSLCGYMTGAGGSASNAAYLNSTAKTFPDKAVRT